MSCQKCKEIEKQNMQGKNLAFIRVGNANVLVCACDYHFNHLRMMMGMDVGFHSPVEREKENEV